MWGVYETSQFQRDACEVEKYSNWVLTEWCCKLFSLLAMNFYSFIEADGSC